MSRLVPQYLSRSALTRGKMGAIPVHTRLTKAQKFASAWAPDPSALYPSGDLSSWLALAHMGQYVTTGSQDVGWFLGVCPTAFSSLPIASYPDIGLLSGGRLPLRGRTAHHIYSNFKRGVGWATLAVTALWLFQPDYGYSSLVVPYSVP